MIERGVAHAGPYVQSTPDAAGAGAIGRGDIPHERGPIRVRINHAHGFGAIGKIAIVYVDLCELPALVRDIEAHTVDFPLAGIIVIVIHVGEVAILNGDAPNRVIRIGVVQLNAAIGVVEMDAPDGPPAMSIIGQANLRIIPGALDGGFVAGTIIGNVALVVGIRAVALQEKFLIPGAAALETDHVARIEIAVVDVVERRPGVGVALAVQRIIAAIFDIVGCRQGRT